MSTGIYGPRRIAGSRALSFFAALVLLLAIALSMGN